MFAISLNFHICFDTRTAAVQRHTIDSTQQFRQQPRQLRAMIPGCTKCSQQRDFENQTSRTCCFCGAYMDIGQHCNTNSNHTSTRRSTTSYMNATHLQSFTYPSASNFRHASTTSVNSSSTIHSSYKVISSVSPKTIQIY